MSSLIISRHPYLPCIFLAGPLECTQYPKRTDVLFVSKFSNELRHMDAHLDVHVSEFIWKRYFCIRPYFSCMSGSFYWDGSWNGRWVNIQLLFVGCCSLDLFKTVRSILVQFSFSVFSIRFVRVYVMHPYSSINTATTWKKFRISDQIKLLLLLLLLIIIIIIIDDLDKLYVSRKGGRGVASIEESFDTLITQPENYIKKSKGRLISATRNNINNTTINRIKTTTRKQKWEEKQLDGHFKR